MPINITTIWWPTAAQKCPVQWPS